MSHREEQLRRKGRLPKQKSATPFVYKTRASDRLSSGDLSQSKGECWSGQCPEAEGLAGLLARWPSNNLQAPSSEHIVSSTSLCFSDSACSLFLLSTSCKPARQLYDSLFRWLRSSSNRCKDLQEHQNLGGRAFAGFPLWVATSGMSANCASPGGFLPSKAFRFEKLGRGIARRLTHLSGCATNTSSSNRGDYR